MVVGFLSHLLAPFMLQKAGLGMRWEVYYIEQSVVFHLAKNFDMHYAICSCSISVDDKRQMVKFQVHIGRLGGSVG